MVPCSTRVPGCIQPYAPAAPLSGAFEPAAHAELTSPDALAGLTSRRVSAALPDYRSIVALYEEAFPEHERMAPWMLRVMARRSCCDFRAFYDEGELCSVAYTVNTPRLVYLLYLAVGEGRRSRGYGSRVLTWLKAQRPRRPIALGIEPVHPAAPNYEQRCRRLAFYERNGFLETGYAYVEGGDTYSIMFNGYVFDPRAMEEAIALLSFGLKPPDVALINNEPIIRATRSLV